MTPTGNVTGAQVSPLAGTTVLDVSTQGGTQPPAQLRNGLGSFQQCHIQRYSPWEMVLLFREQEEMGRSLVKSRVASAQAGFQSVGAVKAAPGPHYHFMSVRNTSPCTNTSCGQGHCPALPV